MQSVTEEQLFQTFRPLCSALATKPTLPILKRLGQKIQIHNGKELGRIEEYIIFPMQLYLKTPTLPENYTLAVFEFVTKFYQKTPLSSKFVFKDVISSLLVMSMGQDKLSEDFKSAFSKLVVSLVKNSNEEVRNYIYDDEMKLPLGHLVFQSLEWAEQDEARQVVLESFSILECLLVNQDDTLYYNKFVDRFCPMLPGITTRLVKAMKRSFPSQSHKIKSKCLQLWSNSVTSLMQDANIDTVGENIVENPNLSRSETLNDPKWVGKAQDHLYQHVQMFVDMAVHPQSMIREALFDLCKALNKLSWSALQNTRPLQVEILSMLCVDHESLDLQIKAQKVLDEMLIRLKKEEAVSSSNKPHPSWLVELAHRKVFTISETVSNPAFTENLFHEEKTLEKHLASLHGFLTLLKAIEDSSLLLYSDTYIIQLLDALTFLVQLEKKSLVSEAASFLNLSNCDFLFQPQLFLASNRPEKLFRHLTSSELIKRVSEIAQVLSQYANCDLIVSHLKRNIQGSKMPRESIFLLNLMISQGLATGSGNNVNNSDLFLYEMADTYIDINPIKTSDQSSWPLASMNSEKTVFGGKNDIDTVEWSLKLLIMDGMASIAKSISINWSENLRNFERDYLCRFLVYCISNVDVTHSHQAHVLYYVRTHHMFSQILKFLFKVKNI